MNLTLKEKQVIEKIIESFGERDNEFICQEAERLSFTYSPLINALADFKPDDNTKDAMNFIEDDSVNGQELLANCWFECVRLRVTYEYALAVFKRRGIYEDAA